MKSFLCVALLLIFSPFSYSVLPVLNPPPAQPRLEPKSLIMVPSKSVRRVAVDAGHGGKDFGAVSPWGIKEKDLVLEIAKAVRDELKANGLEVIMTRSGDHFIPLSSRARIANEKNADLFVSIHANASVSESLNGFEIYYLSDAGMALVRANEPTAGLQSELWDLKEKGDRDQAIRVAGFIQNSIDSTLPVFANRLRSAGFYVLKQTDCPALLIEVGYLTNHEDLTRLEDPEYKRKLVQAVVGGILNYKFDFERSGGPIL